MCCPLIELTAVPTTARPAGHNARRASICSAGMLSGESWPLIGTLGRCRRKIAKQYFKGWFLLDLLTVIPFDIVFQVGSFTNMFKVRGGLRGCLGHKQRSTPRPKLRMVCCGSCKI
jgi:hypothetical protein